MTLECPKCSRVFSLKTNLTRHLRMVHNVTVERFDILPGDFDTYHYKCLEGCNISFKYNRELRKHLRMSHEIEILELNLEFPNYEEFNKWLHNEEGSNYVQYVHLTATKRKSTGTETYYLECNRTGKRIHVDDTVRKRRARKCVNKQNRGCTSQIICHKTHDGSCNVIYYKSHYGHQVGLENVKLSKQERGAVASKLVLGLPASTVLHSAKNTTGHMKRINLLDRKDIVNIRKEFNIDVKEGKLVNTINVNLFLEECSGHPRNPILFCNIYDFPEAEDICLMIMNEHQEEMLRSAGDYIIALNSISLKSCDFELITLFVIDKSWESFPAACMFANKINFSTYQLFFTKIRDRVGNVMPSMLFTNCDEMYYEAWNCVMGTVMHHFYTPIQVDIDWKLNLNRIVCVETEVTKIKRKWVYNTIKSLRNSKEESDFLENFEGSVKILQKDQDFNDFRQYFLSCYSNPKKWADCFKTGLDLPVKQLEVLSDVLKQYLNEEVEVRFDKIFHSLIRFLRDETVNSMLHTRQSRRFFIDANDTRHQLLNERRFTSSHQGENLWNVTELDGPTHVVQKFLNKRCCNLVCTSCHICLHCFSCSCVDFFVSNAICVHIHYVWITYDHSIVQIDEDSCEPEIQCAEEIIIEVDEELKGDDGCGVDVLRKAIVDRTSVLCDKVAAIGSKEVLKVILDNLEQLCELKDVNNLVTVVESGAVEDCSMGDHSYL